MIAANPASAPTEETKWWTDKANGRVRHVARGSLRGSRGIRASSSRELSRVRAPRSRQLGDVLGERCRVAFEHQQVDVGEVCSTHSGSSGSRSARRIFWAGVGCGRS